MSFLRSKIFVAVFSMLALVIQPYAVFAQDFSWTEPSGPPLDNNVAPPVNVGPVGQAKDGEFFIMKQGGVGFAAPFSSASFGTYMPGIFGSPAIDYPSTVNIYGNLLYRPDGTNGATPPAGQVLITDVNGYAKWVDPATIVTPGGDPLPTCAANQVLQVSVAGTWSCGTGASSTTLPAGTNGQTLRWNSTMGQWEPNSVVTITGTGPAVVGVGSSAGNSTGIVNIMTSSTVPNAHITLSSPGIQLQPGSNPIQAGQILTSTTTQGNIGWVDPITLLGSLLPSGNSGETFVHNGTNWTATNKLTHSQTSVPIPAPYEGDFNPDGFMSKISNDVFMLDTAKTILGRAGQGYVNIYGQNAGALSNNFTFTPMNGQTQNVNFYSNNVKFSGPLQNNDWDTKLGRIMFAKDDQGSVKWTKGIQYQEDFEDQYNIFGITDDPGEDDDIPLLWSEGLTYLQGDTRIDGITTINNELIVSEDGDLWLEGIERADEGDNIKHLCVRMTDKKVVRCDFITGVGAEPETQTLIDERTITYSAGTGSIQYPLPDQAPGQVTIKACAGGGGGGGGGRGYDGGGDDNGEEGDGGGGGGGGGKGQCMPATDISFDEGDTLTWSIGDGGDGGSRANFVSSALPGVSGVTDTPATPGDSGGNTIISLNNSQIGPILLGGGGGLPGTSGPFNNTGAPGGQGGSTTIPTTTPWHMGQPGSIGSFGSTGGRGGNGEDIENATWNPYTGSIGGAGGVYSGNDIFGHDGSAGLAGKGGGGGGGGAGEWDQQNTTYGLTTYTAYVQRGGHGGNGGDGYLEITYNAYVSEVVIPDWVREDAGTHTFDPSILPNNVTSITVEVWGAGGGGGKGTNSTSAVFGGGGGAGAYVKKIVPMNSNSSPVTVVVGAGGNPGQGVCQNPQPTTGSGYAGTTSTFDGNVITAPGGDGGKCYPGQYGLGGAGGVSTTGGVILSISGASGGTSDINNWQNNDGAPGTQGYGGGGDGERRNGALPRNPTAGDDGRVLISW
jgi:hypothetical protein